MIQVERTALFRSAFIIICFFFLHKPPVWLSFSFLFVRYFCTFSHFFHFRILIRGIAESKKKAILESMSYLLNDMDPGMAFFLFQSNACKIWHASAAISDIHQITEYFQCSVCLVGQYAFCQYFTELYTFLVEAVHVPYKSLEHDFVFEV